MATDPHHNQSAQKGVVRNDDPALDIAHEHHHTHLHHSAAAMKGRTDEVVYSLGTTAEKSTVPDADPLDHALHNRHHPERHGGVDKKDDIGIDYDTAEKGYGSEDHGDSSGDPHPDSKWKKWYRHWRIAIHVLIVAVFTGLVFTTVF